MKAEEEERRGSFKYLGGQDLSNREHQRYTKDITLVLFIACCIFSEWLIIHFIILVQ